MHFPLTRSGRIWLIALLALAGTLAACLLPPLHQPEAYHHFADDRTLLGIHNCLNVISNAGFLVVGFMGLWFLKQKHTAGPQSAFLLPAERLPYACFVVGVLFTCFGSGYYHWAPSDQTLVWDRLPMTVAFMGLLAAVIAERIDVNWGLRLLWPLLLAGAASVGWWAWRGNLWPYAAAQYLSIVLIGLLTVLFTPRYSRSSDLLWVTGFYALAKVLEALDAPIFGFTHFVSGHTLKHLAATLSAYWILRMLAKRLPLATNSSQRCPDLSSS